MTRTLHEQILNDVRDRIVSGEWPPGHRIPFETDMAQAYGCSRMTVNKALTRLTQAGLLERSRKSGTFVRAPGSVSAAIEISNIRKEVEDAGRSYGYTLLSDKTGPCERAEVRLPGLSSGDRVRELACLHKSDGEPFCFEERLISLKTAPEAGTVSFETVSPSSWMLENIPWNTAGHRIMAVAASEDVADLLRISNGAPCLVIERRTRNMKGFVTWARLTYPGDRHSLFADFTPEGGKS